MAQHIEAASVNHNTSSYMELMLRSLFARHPSGLDLSVTVFDNDSEDDTGALREYAEHMDVPILQSGFNTKSRHNSHGEILQRFVVDRPECSHYLFLDADVCFIEERTLDSMLHELEEVDEAFGIGARMSWDGVSEIPEKVRRENADLYEARLHPCCALVKNTPVFRRVVRDIGLSCVHYLWANGEEYFDTFKLMTRVMGTHGLKHITSSRMVLHFFSVWYDWDPDQVVEMKARRRDALLTRLIDQDAE